MTTIMMMIFYDADADDDADNDDFQCFFPPKSRLRFSIAFVFLSFQEDSVYSSVSPLARMYADDACCCRNRKGDPLYSNPLHFDTFTT